MRASQDMREAFMTVQRWRWGTLALSLLSVTGAWAAEDAAVATAPAPTPAPPRAHGFSLALLGGIAMPACAGQHLCQGLQGPAPTIESFALWKVTRPLGVGLVADVSRVAWEAPLQLSYFGPPSKLRSTLTTGFVGIGARAVLREARLVPILTLAIGSAFQVETESNISAAEARTGMKASCNDGFKPTVQVGIGLSGRVSRRLSAFGLATATEGWKQNDCIPVENEGIIPPHTPVGAWGLALRAGAAFDIGP
jgi:hypothetical protein